MLDYQDMLVGHPAYDLMSLLEDARRDTADALRAAMLARYLERSGAEPEAFAAAAHVLAAQRNLKIIGPLHPALPARRQAALPRAPAAGLGASRPRPRASGARAARRPSSRATLPPPEPTVRARIEAAA